MKYIVSNANSLVVPIFLLAVLTFSENAPAQSPRTASQIKPIKELLYPDGSLNFSGGFSGSVSLAGYRMVAGPGGEPRFAPLDGHRENLTGETMTSPDDAYWHAFSPASLDTTVRAVAVIGTDLYVGGDFTTAGGVTVNRIAKWNGARWLALGTGMDGKVRALAVIGSDLYAGGDFFTADGTTARRVAKWNGTSWSPVGNGLSDGVMALAVGPNGAGGSDLYAGGVFLSAGGTPANRIAKWNGTTWSALGTGVNGSVEALVVSGGELYAGGGFSAAGGVTASHVAKWNDTSWSALGTGISGEVTTLAVLGTNVYAGGWFSMAGENTVNYIAEWNGSSWSDLDGGMNSAGAVYALVVIGTDLYAGGCFTTAGGTPANRMAKWNGTNWSAVSTGMNNTVYALTVSGSNLYAGGDFTAAGGTKADRVAQWNGSNWFDVDAGMNSAVHALAVCGSDVYVAGDFTTAGGTTVNRITKWNGLGWSGLGTGMNGSVSALAVSGNIVYAGGGFTTAGGTSANRIAKWNDTSWSALGTGLSGSVSALAVSGNELYAAGNFTTAGGNTVNNIAKWDGTSWSALGTGTNGYVYALAVSPNGTGGTDVYAGGWFTTAGGTTVNYVAQWDGTNWLALGGGMNNYVDALAVSGSDLYAGGRFTMAGGATVNYTAKWDGTSWSALGTGTSLYVYTLAVSGSDLYAGGGFGVAGGTDVYFIAKWDGTDWSALGSGMNSFVNALAVSGNDLYAGGYFTTAGGDSSFYIGRWVKPASAAAVTQTFLTPATGASFQDASNETAVDLSISSSSGGPTVLVNRYEDAPADSSSIADTASLSPYRWVIQQMGLGPSSTDTVRFNISQVPSNGISDPNSVVIFRRSTPGKGAFTAVTTTYESGDLVGSGMSAFGEFTFGSTANALAVQLIGPSVAAIRTSVELRWSTVTELNNHGFDVERKQRSNPQSETVNLQWSRVGFVPGAGTSSSPRQYFYTDKDLASASYVYRVKQINADGSFVYTAEVEVTVGVPMRFALHQNYPNPFNPTTTIEYDLPREVPVQLNVYDVLGRQVQTLVNDVQPAGYYKLSLDAQHLSSGNYYYRIRAGDFVKVRKLMLVK